MKMTEKNKEDVRTLLKDDGDLLNELVIKCIGDGYVSEQERIYEMETMEDVIDCTEGVELLHRAYNGYDSDFTDECGNHTKPFNPNAYYFYFDDDGNLISTNSNDYTNLIDNVIDYIIHCASYNVPDKIYDLIVDEEDYL